MLSQPISVQNLGSPVLVVSGCVVVVVAGVLVDVLGGRALVVGDDCEVEVVSAAEPVQALIESHSTNGTSLLAGFFTISRTSSDPVLVPKTARAGGAVLVGFRMWALSTRSG